MPITLTRDEDSFELEDRLPVLPLRDVVIFPYMVIPLLVGRATSLAAVEAALAGDRWIFLVAQRAADTQDPAAADLFRVGVAGRVLQVGKRNFRRLELGAGPQVDRAEPWRLRLFGELRPRRRAVLPERGHPYRPREPDFAADRPSANPPATGA